jgi:hypothetical protein
MILAALAAAFLATYASGPAGKDDLVTRAARLAFPYARALPPVTSETK